MKKTIVEVRKVNPNLTNPIQLFPVTEVRHINNISIPITAVNMPDGCFFFVTLKTTRSEKTIEMKGEKALELFLNEPEPIIRIILTVAGLKPNQTFDFVYAIYQKE